jgi:hypothetical protein
MSEKKYASATVKCSKRCGHKITKSQEYTIPPGTGWGAKNKRAEDAWRKAKQQADREMKAHVDKEHPPQRRR